MNKLRLLYVDDEVINTLNFKMIFEDDYEIKIANNGDQALEILESASVDIIFTDQKMPGMSGTDLLYYLAEKGSLVPAYIVTGYFNEDSIQKAIVNRVAVGVLRKPIFRQQIEQILVNYRNS